METLLCKVPFGDGVYHSTGEVTRIPNLCSLEYSFCFSVGILKAASKGSAEDLRIHVKSTPHSRN